ncbi:MAG: hypothetical protein U0R77_13655 [Mycolicibacterium insubricum]|nr:hypothetical protein [Mycobacterium sp.]
MTARREAINLIIGAVMLTGAALAASGAQQRADARAVVTADCAAVVLPDPMTGRR